MPGPRPPRSPPGLEGKGEPWDERDNIAARLAVLPLRSWKRSQSLRSGLGAAGQIVGADMKTILAMASFAAFAAAQSPVCVTGVVQPVTFPTICMQGETHYLAGTAVYLRSAVVPLAQFVGQNVRVEGPDIGLVCPALAPLRKPAAVGVKLLVPGNACASGPHEINPLLGTRNVACGPSGVGNGTDGVTTCSPSSVGVPKTFTAAPVGATNVPPPHATMY